MGDSFQRWGLGHLTMLALTAVGSVVLVVAGRRLRGTAARTVLARTLAVILLVISVVLLVNGLRPANFRIDGSVPLQLSDLLRFICVYALWTRRFWATSVVYYWGLTFNPQSLVTPNLFYGPAPIYDFTAYWAPHILVMWTAIFLTWGLEHKPNWRSYRIAILVTLGWAVVTFVFNVLAGTNYGFLNGKPASASLLDLMGQWPIYLLSAFVAMVVIWALITVPWTISRPITKDRSETPASPG